MVMEGRNAEHGDYCRRWPGQEIVPLYVTRSLWAYHRALFSATFIQVLVALTLRFVVESSGRDLSAVWSTYICLGHHLLLFCLNFIFTCRCAYSYRPLLHRHCRNYKLELIKCSEAQGFWLMESSNGRRGASRYCSVISGLVSFVRFRRYNWPCHTEVPSK